MARGRGHSALRRLQRYQRERREAEDRQRQDAATVRELARTDWGMAETAKLFDVTVWPGPVDGTLRVDASISPLGEVVTRIIPVSRFSEITRLKARAGYFYDYRRTEEAA